MKYIFLLFSSLLLSPGSYAISDTKEILNKMAKAMKGHNSITYNINYIFKGVDRDDTLFFSQRIYLMRDWKDELWKGKIWMADFDKANEYFFYNSGKIYMVDKVKLFYRILTPDTKGDRMPQLTTSLVVPQFFSSNPFDIYLSSVSKKCNDTTINGEACYQLECDVDYPYGGGKAKDILFVNKSNFFPVLRREYLHFDDRENQYCEWFFSNYAFDNVDERRFSKEQIPEYFNLRD